MDPIEEFEFRPLTKGLGFHKKSVDLRKETKSVGFGDSSERSRVPEPPEALLGESTFSDPDYLNLKSQISKNLFEDIGDPLLDRLDSVALENTKKEIPITSTLPRAEDKIDVNELFLEPATFSEEATVPNIDLQEKLSSASMKSESFHGSRKGRPRVTGLWSLPAAMLDGVLVSALTLLFLMPLLAITKIDFLMNLTHQSADPLARLSIVALFLALVQMYMIVSRSFFGRSLGEWTFDLKLGRDAQMERPYYPFRVALRSVLTTATGFLPFVLLTILSGVDVCGKVCGLSLYRSDD